MKALYHAEFLNWLLAAVSPSFPMEKGLQDILLPLLPPPNAHQASSIATESEITAWV